jgi:hypothetical protein
MLKTFNKYFFSLYNLKYRSLHSHPINSDGIDFIVLNFTVLNFIILNFIGFIFVVSIFIFSIENCFAQTSFVKHRDKNNHFAINIPFYLTVMQSNYRNVVFFARSSRGNYPTITVTQHPGIYTPKRADEHQIQVRDSYRKVGFTDAVVIDTNKDRFTYMTKTRNSVVVEYSLQGYKIISEVTYVSTANSHYIITYVDTPTQFTANSIDRRQVLNSFTLNRSILAQIQSRNNNYVNNRYNAPVRARYGSNLATTGNSSNSIVPPYQPDKSPPVMGSFLLVAGVIVAAATLFRQT